MHVDDALRARYPQAVGLVTDIHHACVALAIKVCQSVNLGATHSWRPVHTRSKLPGTLSGAVLAGGQGQRMGGVNKGLVTHNGRYLFEYAVNNLRPHVSDLVIVTNTCLERYQALGYEAIDDGRFRGCGPLAGLHAALRHAKTPFVAIAPCDQGPLPEGVYPRLYAAAEQSTSGAAVLSVDGRCHPTTAVLGVVLAGALFSSLQSGRFRLIQWCEAISAVEVSCPGLEFQNYNTPQDLATDT